MKNKITYLLLSISLVAFLSCVKRESNKDQTPVPAAANASLRLSGAVTSPDVYYKNEGNPQNSFVIRYFPNEPARPLIIAFHGGGFFAGDKSGYFLPLQFNVNSTNSGTINLITPADLDNYGYAFASVNYSLLGPYKSITAIDCINDGKDFLTYIRANAAAYHIDPNKIILLGESGGAGISMWLGLQNNINSGIKGIVALNPQATLNILKWRNEVYAPVNSTSVFDTYISASLANVGAGTMAQYGQKMYGTTNQAAIENYSNVHSLNFFYLFDSADPELYMACGASPTDAVHAPAHDWALKQHSAAAGHTAKLNYANGNPAYYNPSPETVLQFIVRKFQ